MLAVGIYALLALKVRWVHEITYGDAIVGIGTLLLALFTVYLGAETRASARAARRAVETSEEPFLIATPTPDWALMHLRDYEKCGEKPEFKIHRSVDREGESQAFVRLRLWNLGNGPAIATDVSITAEDVELLDALPQDYVLGPHGVADIEIPSYRWVNRNRSPRGSLEILYRHSSGRQYRTSSEIDIAGPFVLCRTYERARPVKRLWWTRWRGA
ncbi:MAG TPA: hypothetical protein VMB05_03415 [Solirubrobacteraceae bacterium]|nr:hypothetical protein [Solirubrobacteraceae bacterium]